MSKHVKKRLRIFAFFAVTLSAFFYFLVESFTENMMFFLTPTTLLSAENLPNRSIRLGGLVKSGSVQASKEKGVRFTVVDQENEVDVEHHGFIPALFRENQGVVVEGRYNPQSKLFVSKRLLAKHDETYRIPNAEESLDAQKKLLQKSLIAAGEG